MSHDEEHAEQSLDLIKKLIDARHFREHLNCSKPVAMDFIENVRKYREKYYSLNAQASEFINSLREQSKEFFNTEGKLTAKLASKIKELMRREKERLEQVKQANLEIKKRKDKQEKERLIERIREGEIDSDEDEEVSTAMRDLHTRLSGAGLSMSTLRGSLASEADDAAGAGAAGSIGLEARSSSNLSTLEKLKQWDDMLPAEVRRTKATEDDIINRRIKADSLSGGTARGEDDAKRRSRSGSRSRDGDMSDSSISSDAESVADGTDAEGKRPKSSRRRAKDFKRWLARASRKGKFIIKHESASQSDALNVLSVEVDETTGCMRLVVGTSAATTSSSSGSTTSSLASPMRSLSPSLSTCSTDSVRMNVGSPLSQHSQLSPHSVRSSAPSSPKTPRTPRTPLIHDLHSPSAAASSSIPELPTLNALAMQAEDGQGSSISSSPASSVHSRLSQEGAVAHSEGAAEAAVVPEGTEQSSEPEPRPAVQVEAQTEAQATKTETSTPSDQATEATVANAVAVSNQ